GADCRTPAQLHRSADAVAFARADDRRRRVRGAPRRPAAVHPLRQGHLRAAGRPHAGRAEEGITGRQLVAGWRQQGHLGARAMLSRVADSIYWMSRYIERAENVARFVDVNLNLMLDLPGNGDQQWQPLVDITGDHELFAERCGKPTQRNVIQFLTFDTDNV